MEKTMHECLSIDNTTGWITQILTDDENEIKAKMDWQTKRARVHIESGFREYPVYVNWKKQGTQTTSFTTITLSFLDDKRHTKFNYVLRNRDYNGPSMQYISRTGNNNYKVPKGSGPYESVLDYIKYYLLGDNEDMDLTTSSVLTYMLEQMQLEKCDNTSCPEFLSRLVELGNQQREQRIKQGQNVTPEEDTLIR